MRDQDTSAVFLTWTVVLALLVIVSIGFSRSTYSISDSVRVLEPPGHSKLFAAPSKFLLDSFRDRFGH
jgi:hypothetical protein